MLAPNSMLISEKTNKPNVRADGRMDTPYFIGPFQLKLRVQKAQSLLDDKVGNLWGCKPKVTLMATK